MGIADKMHYKERRCRFYRKLSLLFAIRDFNNKKRHVIQSVLHAAAIVITGIFLQLYFCDGTHVPA